MDFKGIKWAGNIYQKFETMCLEVEEVMVEDTVKYMENKVQKVGVSVKKFYSEVMQDILPPSYIDPVKVAAGDLPLNPYAHCHTVIKKPKQSILDSQIDNKKTETPDEDVNHLSQQSSSRVFVENSNPELYSAKNKKLGIQRRPIGIRRISNNKKVSSPMNSISGDLSKKLVSDDEFVRQNNKDSSECSLPAPEKTLPTESIRLKKDDSKCTSLASNKNISPESPKPKVEDDCNLPGSEKVLSEESVRQTIGVDSVLPPLPSSEEDLSTESVNLNIDNPEFTLPASTEILSTETTRQRKDDYECASLNHGLSSESIGGTSKKDGSFSQSDITSSNTWEVESSGMKVIESYEDNFDDMEFIENDEVDFEPTAKSKLEETCVLVEGDGNELHFVQGIKKHKSYKKTIREALSSKLRSPTKKQSEIKDSAVKLLKTNSEDKRKQKADDSYESDWELL